ncbi:YlbF family regulator [Streptococcus sp. zg-JUN1979]|uniref:YlbF family regulator n=1 Tax=Streptococcus sp. zg-JUN1979 TaxID=3391450 RepID=UPI0039A54A08
MLRIDEELLAIDDAIEELVEAFVIQEEAKCYRLAKEAVLKDRDLAQKMAIFEEKRSSYEKEAAYSAFRSEIKEQKKELYRLKRQLDLHPKLVALRQSETRLQESLAKISRQLSEAVSSDIFVDTGLPLAPHKRHHKPNENPIRERSSHAE